MSESFMKLEVFKGHIQRVSNTEEGDVHCPECYAQYPGNDDAAKAYNVELDNVDTICGYAWRLSAPGFTDCTEWTGLETFPELVDDIISTRYDEFEADNELALIELVHNWVCESLFLTTGQDRDYIDTITMIRTLASLCEDYSGDTEHWATMGSEDHTSIGDLFGGAYWFAYGYHSGDKSEEYALLSGLTKVYSPSRLAKKADESEESAFDALVIKHNSISTAIMKAVDKDIEKQVADATKHLTNLQVAIGSFNREQAINELREQSTACSGVESEVVDYMIDEMLLLIDDDFDAGKWYTVNGCSAN